MGNPTWERQITEIRQGCPLSPYLFILVTTVIYQDLNEHNKKALVRHIPGGLTSYILLHADDTVNISEQIRKRKHYALGN